MNTTEQTTTLAATLSAWTPPTRPTPAAPTTEAHTQEPHTPRHVRQEMPPEAKARRAAMQLESAENVAAAIHAEAPEIAEHMKRVGAWLWVQFPSKPQPATLAKLKELGFTWNRTREAWQNPCGVFRRANRRIDPREVYGEERI